MSFLLPWSGVALSFGLYKLFPTSFNTLFLINIWLFSLPHTFSTFTRVDRRSKLNIAVTVGLLVGFAVLTMGVALGPGMVVLYSGYFYWQQFHYGKQNFGLAKWETGKTAKVDQFFYLLMVLLSLIGLLSSGPQAFFGYMLYAPVTLPFSKLAIFISMMMLTALYCWWRPAQKTHALSHTFIFSFSYLATEHFAVGWLFLNVFHNLQYLSFMKNYEKQMKFLLLPVCFTFALYLIQFHLLQGMIIYSLPVSLTIMMALNFTHYTLDAVIWKKQKV